MGASPVNLAHPGHPAMNIVDYQGAYEPVADMTHMPHEIRANSGTLSGASHWPRKLEATVMRGLEALAPRQRRVPGMLARVGRGSSFGLRVL